MPEWWLRIPFLIQNLNIEVNAFSLFFRISSRAILRAERMAAVAIQYSTLTCSERFFHQPFDGWQDIFFEQNAKVGFHLSDDQMTCIGQVRVILKSLPSSNFYSWMSATNNLAGSRTQFYNRHFGDGGARPQQYFEELNVVERSDSFSGLTILRSSRLPCSIGFRHCPDSH